MCTTAASPPLRDGARCRTQSMRRMSNASRSGSRCVSRRRLSAPERRFLSRARTLPGNDPKRTAGRRSGARPRHRVGDQSDVAGVSRSRHRGASAAKLGSCGVSWRSRYGLAHRRVEQKGCSLPALHGVRAIYPERLTGEQARARARQLQEGSSARSLTSPLDALAASASWTARRMSRCMKPPAHELVEPPRLRYGMRA